MDTAKQKVGFMPLRIRFNCKPSSFGTRQLVKSSKLELDKIWQQDAKEPSAPIGGDTDKQALVNQ